MHGIVHPVPERRTFARWIAALAAVLMLAVAALAVPQDPAQAQATNCASPNAKGKAPANPKAANCHVSMQFLWVSDWHAQLDPLDVFGVGQVGGAAAISTYWQQDRAAFPGRTLTLTAGDAYGAAPPLSGFFDEVPGVLAQRLMGFDVDTFGNHNFDRGIDHLQQMIDLAGAPSGEEPGTPFQYVSANLANRDDNLKGVKDYEIFDVDGVKVAIIGLTNEEAPTLVFPGNFGTIEVTDSVAAANRAREEARAEGAKVFIIITHKGVTGFDGQGNAVGPLIDLANELEGFHIIFGDHTDVEFEGMINGQLVVENRSKGLTYGRTHLTVDRRNGATVSRSNQFITPFADQVTPDPAIVAMLAPFRVALAEAFDAPVGVATDTFPRGGTPAVERVGEVAIGNLVADSMRLRYGTQLAFTNGGGIRTPLPSSYLPQDTSLRRPSPGFAPGPPWDLVVGDIFATLPFGNSVITRTVTGAQVHAILEHGVAAMPSANGRFPQISGFRFTYDVALPAGSRLLSVELDDGTPILADNTVYTLATNDFVNAGGDGYTMLSADPGDSATREVMADVLLEHIQAQGTITPTIEGRIIRLN
jgi:5'-nucleotidase